MKSYPVNSRAHALLVEGLQAYKADLEMFADNTEHNTPDECDAARTRIKEIDALLADFPAPGTIPLFLTDDAPLAAALEQLEVLRDASRDKSEQSFYHEEDREDWAKDANALDVVLDAAQRDPLNALTPQDLDRAYWKRHRMFLEADVLAVLEEQSLDEQNGAPQRYSMPAAQILKKEHLLKRIVSHWFNNEQSRTHEDEASEAIEEILEEYEVSPTCDACGNTTPEYDVITADWETEHAKLLCSGCREDLLESGTYTECERCNEVFAPARLLPNPANHNKSERCPYCKQVWHA